MPKYVFGKQPIENVEAELDRLWAALPNDPGLQADLKAAQIKPAAIPKGSRAKLLPIKPTSHGVVLEGAIVVVGAAVAKRVLLDLWTHILLPRLRAKFGGAVLRDAPVHSAGKSARAKVGSGHAPATKKKKL